MRTNAPTLVTDLRWNWEWSPWATALILAAAFLWVATVYANEQRFVSSRKRTLLALLRLITVALVLAMLAQPTIERIRVAPARLILLLDNSASMDTRDVSYPPPSKGGARGGIPDRGDTSNLTRREVWQSLLTAGPQPLLDALRLRFSAETLTFNATVTPLPNASPTPSPQPPLATHLGDAIDHALRHLPGPRPAAIVLMTDGINTGGIPLADAAARARTLGVPLHIVALGSDRPRPDVSLDDVLVEDVVFPGDRLQIEAAVRAVGYAGKPARVTLKRIDAKTDGDLLAETQITLPADGESQTVRLALRPTDPGPMRIALEVEPQPGEDDVANNRTELTIDVRDRPIRALLVASTPSFEYRALKSLLERDPAIHLRVRLQDADPDYANVDEAALCDFPATEAELLEYDVVLLGDVDPQLLPRQTWDLLQKFVSIHGGGLVLIAGPRFMPQAFADIDPMRTLLPIDADAHATNRLRLNADTAALRIQPTPLGLEDPSLQLGETPTESAAIWAELPPVLWSLNAPLPNPAAQTLAAGIPANRSRLSADREGEALAEPTIETPPMILRQYVGAGEVLLHATDETWRRAGRTTTVTSPATGARPSAVLPAAEPSARLSPTANRAEYDPNAPVIIRLRLSAQVDEVDASPTIELVGDSTPTRQVPLMRKTTHANLFDATLRDLPPDHYTMRLASQPDDDALTAEFTITAPPDELANVVVNTSGLAAAAAATGGKLYTAETASRLRDELPVPRPTAVEQLPDEPLWNSPWLMAAVCITLGSEWLLRRRAGML